MTIEIEDLPLSEMSDEELINEYTIVALAVHGCDMKFHDKYSQESKLLRQELLRRLANKKEPKE